MENLFKGIDVSKWQGEIDWYKVKKSGVQFAMLRCGYGMVSGQHDEYFETNYKNAKANGIPVGAYHYSYAKSADEAKREADYCISLLKGKSFEFPVALDIEDKSQQDLSNNTIMEIIKTFCETLESAGYYVSVYANLWWYNNKIHTGIPKLYDAWLAQWSDAPTLKADFGMWQYTSSGSVDGINGRVDMNYAYKNYPNIMKSNGLNGFAQSKPIPQKPQAEFVPRQAISLDNIPLYVSATAVKESARKSGTYYIYDGIEISGRYRITSSAERAEKKPVSTNVTGYVNKKDIK